MKAIKYISTNVLDFVEERASKIEISRPGASGYLEKKGLGKISTKVTLRTRSTKLEEEILCVERRYSLFSSVLYRGKRSKQLINKSKEIRKEKERYH